MICEKCGMGVQSGWYTCTTTSPDPVSERRRELLELATAIYTHSDDGVGARLAVEAAINLIAAVDEFIKKDESP